MNANVDEFMIYNLERPGSSSALQPRMGDLSLERKRPAASEVQASETDLRADSRHKRSSPQGSGKVQAPRKAQKPRTAQHSGIHSNSPYDRPGHRKHSLTPFGATSPAALWSKARPRGPTFSVNDSIKTLFNLFGPQQLTSPFFTFSRSVDETASDESEILATNDSIVKAPDSRPITQQQLAAEVKGIYSGLVMVENKCVQVVSKHTEAMQKAEAGDEQARHSLRIDHFQALIALHRTLLHEHHDFFHASQHPSAGPAIRDLALRYSMPARMWKHGIHNFLELLRHRLPESLDYMLAFIYLAYQMMALLYETVPSFEDTWIECLGDLGRYRMAIEDEDLRDREVWTGVAKFWYMKAVDKNPSIGRLYRTYPVTNINT